MSGQTHFDSHLNAGAFTYFRAKMNSATQSLQTSHSPMKILRATRKPIPALADSGVSSVNRAVDRMPSPNRFLPPNFRARKPPGSCVSR